MIKTSLLKDVQSAVFEATSPANIAFIKYWGKSSVETQWPANDSISMTLSKSLSTTTCFQNGEDRDFFSFDGIIVDSITQPELRVFKQLNLLREATGKDDRFLSIESKNTFPASCGIASSASGYSALTLAAMASLTDSSTWDELETAAFPRGRIANLARMGSGSASRSLYGGFVKWMRNDTPDMQKIEPIFSESHWDLHDLIVVISSQKKATSSSDAHTAAWGSPLLLPRLAGMDQRIKKIEHSILKRDIEALGSSIEDEALEMHAVAMTGHPSVNYFTEETVAFLAWVRKRRAAGTLNAWFTIDAGPNVHLITEQKDAAAVINTIKAEWPHFAIIDDRVGAGPSLKRRG